MIGHTGNVEATVQALEFIDQCIGQVYQALCDAGRDSGKDGGTLIITADHGNVERMIDANGRKMTSHTTNRVPFILVDDDLRNVKLREGELDDIAPTILQLLGLKQPVEMTGETLITSGLEQYDQPSLFGF
jgi:2,3-bisphosphoglycerate-independent phosphoglycerate mutase